MHQYELRRQVLGDKRTIAITREYFNSVKEAKRALVGVMLLEEKFDILLENYFTFEQYLLTMAQRTLMFSSIEWDELVGATFAADRHLTNVLSSCQMYIDHTKHDLSILFGRTSTQLANFKMSLSRAYDTCLGFRLMKELRDHSQHRALPIDMLGHSWRRVEKGDEVYSRFNCSAQLDVSTLKEAGGFEPRVLAELERLKNPIHIPPLLRDYISCLGSVHNQLRSLIAADLTAWDSTLRGASDRFRTTHGEPMIGLAILRRSEGNRPVEWVHVFDKIIERRLHLQRKNHDLTNLSKRFVSSVHDL